MCGIGQSGQNCQIKPPEFIRYQTGGLGGTICLTISFQKFWRHFWSFWPLQTFFRCEQDLWAMIPYFPEDVNVLWRILNLTRDEVRKRSNKLCIKKKFSGVITCCFDQHQCVRDWTEMQKHTLDVARLQNTHNQFRNPGSTSKAQKFTSRKKWRGWATRPVTSSRTPWMLASALKTVKVWRSKSLPRIARKMEVFSSAASEETLPFATNAGVVSHHLKTVLRNFTQVLLHTWHVHLPQSWHRAGGHIQTHSFADMYHCLHQI